MPPSISTGIAGWASASASTIGGKASMLLIAPSSWRPPWLDTMMPSTPSRAA
jgi:hypothetical protein